MIRNDSIWEAGYRHILLRYQRTSQHSRRGQYYWRELYDKTWHGPHTYREAALEEAKKMEDRTARDVLENKDPETLTEREHMAIAVYYLADILGEAMIPDEDDED